MQGAKINWLALTDVYTKSHVYFGVTCRYLLTELAAIIKLMLIFKICHLRDIKTVEKQKLYTKDWMRKIFSYLR